jgi:hypothetical protein
MLEQIATSQINQSLVILNLNEEFLERHAFSIKHSGLLECLSASPYNFQYLHRSESALRYLLNTRNRPIAILIVDAAILKAKNAPILEQVEKYTKQGGIALFMANFGFSVESQEMNSFWTNIWGLKWKSGNYMKIDLWRNW